jgi:Ca2+-binding RTX toxin-like protein
MALMVGTLAAAAYALEPIIGTTLDDVLLESPQDDIIMGLAGHDYLDASLYPPPDPEGSTTGDKDVLQGGSGDDILDATDGFPRFASESDILNGGSGHDECFGDFNDIGGVNDTFIGCEFINGVAQ